LLDREGARWRKRDGGLPAFVELGLDESPTLAAEGVPDAVLLALHRAGWLEYGLEPPRRAASTLRRELEKRLRASSRGAPRTRLVPVSEAAIELGVPQRTLRDQIRRGARIAASVPGRRGPELAVELDVAEPVRVRLPRFRPDPRRLARMALEGCRRGQRHRLGYQRRRDGRAWERAEKLASAI
jgi:hypothetical protein